jgi:hypothetical protein
MSGPKARIPDCHPDRKHFGNGLCASCYQMAWRKAHAEPKLPRQPRMADCHPDRKHRAKGMCESCYQMAWMKAHPEADTGNTWLRNRPELHKQMNRRYHLWHKHRTRVEQYVEAWHRQDGICANPRCDRWYPLELDDHRKGLHVDHDHATGEFRALLCPGCNVAIAMAADNPVRLVGLVEYLKLHGYGEN